MLSLIATCVTDAHTRTWRAETAYARKTKRPRSSDRGRFVRVESNDNTAARSGFCLPLQRLHVAGRGRRALQCSPHASSRLGSGSEVPRQVDRV